MDSYYKTFVDTYQHNGVTFYDIDPLLNNYDVSNQAFTRLASLVKKLKVKPNKILGIDSRGFAVAGAVAHQLQMGWMMVRKTGKTPGITKVKEYMTEYGTRSMEIKKNLITAGDRVLIVDDVLATGGTARALADLVEESGGKIAGFLFLIEILGLNGRNTCRADCISLIKLNHNESTSALTSALTTSTSTSSSSSSFTSASKLKSLPPLIASETDKVVLLCFPSMYESANELMKLHPDKFVVANIHWDRFPDGQPNIHFEYRLADREVVYLGSLYDQDMILEQIMLIMVLPRQGLRKLTVYFPYYSMGTMERVDSEGTLATADTLAMMMTKSIPMTQNGLTNLCIYDIHALQERFYFPDTVRLRLLSGIALMRNIAVKPDTVIVFPDDGACKRFSGCFAEDQPKITCSKIRIGEQRITKIKDKVNVSQQTRAIIVDDLVQTGGTLFECMQSLKKEGFTEVSAYVTHAVFPNECHLDFLDGGSKAGFHRFYVTNSVPEVTRKLRNYPLFHIISLMPSFAKELVELPIKHLYIGSTNKHKILAVENAFNTANYESKFIAHGVDVQSGVPEQPVGDEIALGAQNRCKYDVAKTKQFRENGNYSSVHYAKIGIESGLVKINNIWHDVTEIAIVFLDEDCCNSYKMICRTLPIEIPAEFQSLAEQASKEATTFGKLLQYHDSSISHDNWHKSLCGIDRYKLIEDTIISRLNFKSKE